MSNESYYKLADIELKNLANQLPDGASVKNFILRNDGWNEYFDAAESDKLELEKCNPPAMLHDYINELINILEQIIEIASDAQSVWDEEQKLGDPK